MLTMNMKIAIDSLYYGSTARSMTKENLGR